MFLATKEEASAHICKRIDSKEWWVFVANTTDGIHMVSSLEAKFYSGKKNRDFELLMIPAIQDGHGIIGVFLAKKKHMKPRDLASSIGLDGDLYQEEVLAAKDIIVAHHCEEYASGLLAYVLRQIGK
jgi:hypothetical protein